MNRITRFAALVALAATLATSVSYAGQATPKSTTAGAASAAAKAAPAAPAAKPATVASTTPAAKATPAAKEPLDINTASREELMKLPGVGEKTADKIIAGRPFKSKSELKQKGIVTSSTYTKIHQQIIAKQAR